MNVQIFTWEEIDFFSSLQCPNSQLKFLGLFLKWSYHTFRGPCKDWSECCTEKHNGKACWNLSKTQQTVHNLTNSSGVRTIHILSLNLQYLILATNGEAETILLLLLAGVELILDHLYGIG